MDNIIMNRKKNRSVSINNDLGTINDIEINRSPKYNIDQLSHSPFESPRHSPPVQSPKVQKNMFAQKKDNNLGLDFLANPKKIYNEDDYVESESEPEESFDEPGQFIPDSNIQDDDSDDDDDKPEQKNHEKEQKPFMTYAEKLRRKQEILFRLERLKSQGYVCHRQFSMSSDIDEMEFELGRLEYKKGLESGIKTCRLMLIGFTAIAEKANIIYNPLNLDLQLDGWSENVSSEIEEYDDIFEELYEKYHSKVSAPPEIRLLFMLSYSAIQFHITKSAGNFQRFDTKTFNVPTNVPPSNEERYEMNGPPDDMEEIIRKMMEQENHAPDIRDLDPSEDSFDEPKESETKQLKINTKSRKGRKKK